MDNRPVQEKIEQQARNGGENPMPMLAASAALRLVRDILGRLNSPYAEAAGRPMRPATLWRQVARRLGLFQEPSSSPSASFLPTPNSGVTRPHFIWRARPIRRPLVEADQWAEEPMLTLGPQVEPGRNATSVVAPPAIVAVQPSPAEPVALSDVTPAAAPLILPEPPLAEAPIGALPDVAQLEEVAVLQADQAQMPPAFMPPATRNNIAPQTSAPPNIMTSPEVARRIENAPATATSQQATSPLPSTATDVSQPPTFIAPDAQQSGDSTEAQTAQPLSVAPPEIQPQAAEMLPQPSSAHAWLPSATIPFATSAAAVPAMPSLPAALQSSEATESEPPRFVPARVVRVTYMQGSAVVRPEPLPTSNNSISRPNIAASLAARLYGAEPLPASGDALQTAGQPEFTYARSFSQRRRQPANIDEAPIAEVRDDSGVARVAFTRRPIIAADNPLVPTADLLARMEYSGVLQAARLGEKTDVPPEQIAYSPTPVEQPTVAAAPAETPLPLAMPLTASGARQSSALEVNGPLPSAEPARGPVARLLDKVLAVLPLREGLRRTANPDVPETPAAQSRDVLTNAVQYDAPVTNTLHSAPQAEAQPADNPVQFPLLEQETPSEISREAREPDTTPDNLPQEIYQPTVQHDLEPRIGSALYAPAQQRATQASSPDYKAEANQSAASQPVATGADSLPAPLAAPVPVGGSPQTPAPSVPQSRETVTASQTLPVAGTFSAPSVGHIDSGVHNVAPSPLEEGAEIESNASGGAATRLSAAPDNQGGTPGIVGAIISRLLRGVDASTGTGSSERPPVSMPWRRSRRQQKVNQVDYTDYEEISGEAITPQPQKSAHRAESAASLPVPLDPTATNYLEPASSTASIYVPHSSQAAATNLAAFEATDVAPILDSASASAVLLDATAPALAVSPSVADAESSIDESLESQAVSSQVNVPEASTQLTFDVSEAAFSVPQVERSVELEASRVQETTYAPTQPTYSLSADEGTEAEAFSEVWSAMPEVAQEVSRTHLPLTGFSPMTTVLRSGGLLGRLFAGRSSLVSVQGQAPLGFEGQYAPQSTSEVSGATAANYAVSSPITGVLGVPPTAAGLTFAAASGSGVVQHAVSPVTRATLAQPTISPTARVASAQAIGNSLPTIALSGHPAQGMLGQSSRSGSLASATSPQAVAAFVPAAARPSMVMRTPQQMSSTLAPYIAEGSNADLLMDAGEVESLLHSLYAPDPTSLEMPLAIPYSGFASAPEDVAYPQQAGAGELFGGYAAETSVSSADGEWVEEGGASTDFGGRQGWAAAPSRRERSSEATITSYSWGPSGDDGSSSEASAWADVVASAVDSGPGISAPSYVPALALAGEERAPSQSSQGSGGSASGSGGEGGQQEEQKMAEGSKAGPDPAELDALADTVYDIIRRRITVERERYFA